MGDTLSWSNSHRTHRAGLVRRVEAPLALEYYEDRTYRVVIALPEQNTLYIGEGSDLSAALSDIAAELIGDGAHEVLTGEKK